MNTTTTNNQSTPHLHHINQAFPSIPSHLPHTLHINKQLSPTNFNTSSAPSNGYPFLHDQDIATATNILAKYLSKPTLGHLNHCKHVLRYLKGTIDKGISFSAEHNFTLSSFVHFLINDSILTGLADANWGPQDQSIKKQSSTVPLFHSRSMSGYIQWLNGPLHWTSKRQTITARSTAEAEIYATDECTKNILNIKHILTDLELLSTFCPEPTIIYNDNNACVLWSSNMTTKGLRHIQIRENAVRESIQSKSISVQHIAGSINISDLFTKEDKDTNHFISLRDVIMSDRPTWTATSSIHPSEQGGCRTLPLTAYLTYVPPVRMDVCPPIY